MANETRTEPETVRAKLNRISRRLKEIREESHPASTVYEREGDRISVTITKRNTANVTARSAVR